MLNASNMLIVAAAQGSTHWFTPSANASGFRAGLRVMDSVNVTIKGLVLDHDPLPYIQAELTAILPAETAGGSVRYRFELGVRSLGFEALDGPFSRNPPRPRLGLC